MPSAGIIALGLVTGCLAGLNSIGFVLLWRTSRVVNVAQPALGLVGGVLTGMLVVANGWGFWWAAPVGMAVGAGLSVLAERAVLSRLQEVPRSVLLIATVGLAQIFLSIYGAIPFIVGDGRLPTYTIQLGDLQVYVKPLVLLGPHLLALAALPLAAFVVHRFLTRSRIGIAALALGQDTERARALGVPAGLVRTVVWAIAGAIGSISGILSIPILGFGLEGGALGPTVLLLALAPAVLVGLRSIWGAALVAVLLGVAYQVSVDVFGSAGPGELVLVGSVVAALAIRRGRVGREEAAARASSWEAATAVRPLPWRVSSHVRVHAAGLLLTAIGILTVTLPPLLLGPSARVSYGTAAATVLGALGVTCAWMFAGELPLGHWGFAGLGVVAASIVPGGWVTQLIVGAIAIAIVVGISALLTRSHSSLAFSVLGLAAASAAYILVRDLEDRAPIQADPGVVALVAGGLAIATVVFLVRLRSSTLGTGMVAARDDPARAPWLGVDPLRARVVGLAFSGLIVGAAGVLHAASTPSGITPGAFAPERSLVLLAIAVVGGLGSPVGTLVAGAALLGAERLLPPPWSGLTSGLGVVLVVLFLPAGFARVLERIRDSGIRLLGAGDVRASRSSSEPSAPTAVLAASADQFEVPA